MRERDFETWLERCYRGRNGAPLDPRTRASRFSSTRRLDRALGSLDEHSRKDRGEIVLKKLRYSRAQASHHVRPRHGIPIDGDPYTGTASLRSAAILYFEFCVHWPEGGAPPECASSPTSPPAARVARRGTVGTAAWPVWPSPADEDILPLAQALARHARFVHPDLVAAVVEDNERHRAEWTSGLRSRGVDPVACLWDRSACAFPGVRRYAGSAEIAEFHGHREARQELKGAIALDDNTYPKQMWSFILRGRPFQQFGPVDYSLAHLADHKEFGNRGGTEVQSGEGASGGTLHGLFTSAANTVYLPTSLIRPTDHAAPVRNLLLRRAQEIYGGVANLFPPPYKLPEGPTAAWAHDRFTWCAPVGTLEHLPRFLAFRSQRMEELLSGVPGSARKRRGGARP